MIIVQTIEQGKHASVGSAVAAYLNSTEGRVIAVLPVKYLFGDLVRVEVITRHD